MLYSDTLKSVLQDATSNFGFGFSNSHFLALSGEVFSLEERAEHFHRYTNCRSRRDPAAPDYNANEIGKGLYSGEGPYLGLDYDNIKRFFDQVIVGGIKARLVVAIGPFYQAVGQRWNFSDYFTGTSLTRDQLFPYRVSSKRIVDGDDFAMYIISVRLSGSKSRHTVTVCHFKTMQDFKTLDINDHRSLIIAQLIKISESRNDMNTFLHCSAGLGRAGVFALAMLLYEQHEVLDQLDMDALSEKIVSIWNELNQKRPGTIQTFDQLINAVQLADAMKALQQDLLTESSSLEEFIGQEVTELKRRAEGRRFLTMASNTIPTSESLPVAKATCPTSESLPVAKATCEAADLPKPPFTSIFQPPAPPPTPELIEEQIIDIDADESGWLNP